MSSRTYGLAEFKALRKKMKVTQKALAAKCKLSQSYIADLENGKRVGSPALWGKLLFHLSPDDQIEETAEEISELAGKLSPGEPSIIASFLERFTTQLKLHFLCPVCKQLRPFRTVFDDSTYQSAVDPSLPAYEHLLKLSCTHCQEHNPMKCGGYCISWYGRPRRQRFLMMSRPPEAKVYVKRIGLFDGHRHNTDN